MDSNSNCRSSCASWGIALTSICAAQLLEINLIQTPQVADAILANGVLTHYDRPRCLPPTCSSIIGARPVSSGRPGDMCIAPN